MSMYRLLYYPDFYPDERWLRRVLLLADEVSRIVPQHVSVQDPDGLAAFHEALPTCLSSIPPHEQDVGFEQHDLRRLAKVFSHLADQKPSFEGPKTLTTHVGPGGGTSVKGHVFLHDDKMSLAVRDELSRHGLLVGNLASALGHDRWAVVDERASNVILSALAAKMARRFGLDTITDRPLPFVSNSLSGLGIERADGHGRAEGALLSAMASLLIPTATGKLPLSDYRELRESYAGIRKAFQALTSETSRINRLDRMEDPVRFRKAVEAAADELFAQYQAHRRSRFAKSFYAWAPLYIGSLVAAGSSALAGGPLAVGGASFAIKVIEKRIARRDSAAGHDRTFQMLAGLRKDIVQRATVAKLL